MAAMVGSSIRRRRAKVWLDEVEALLGHRDASANDAGPPTVRELDHLTRDEPVSEVERFGHGYSASRNYG
ncbi:hypothetical protein [Caulobacter sp. UNC279MFTsu5.1]|uniref:hypothetical protein n=1 Tax=Caulobacter sp. UNC279MFTsu5.1 TaxID=1502775 RepID=UPI0003FE76E1|nr:hypothetical protein [Caulobacter sp. UNC279MFTsu5.1]